tara:strand:- start:13191 stop:13337 length:147 start_codon:yes stop_codon:yes gene_type:complete
MGDLIFYPVDEDPKQELIYIKIRMNGLEQTIHVPYTQRNSYKTRRDNG